MTDVTIVQIAGKPKLLDQVRQLMRLRYYSIRTEEAYVGWMRRYILFHGKRHPKEPFGGAHREFPEQPRD